MAIQKIPNTLIADNAVTAAKIANGTLTADDIAANSITGAKISATTSLNLGGLNVSGNVTGNTIASTGGSTNNRGMLLSHQNNTNQSYVGRSENGAADTGNRITFDYDNDKMQLDSDGDIILTPTSNVGIGTTNPDNKLHVQTAALSGRSSSNANTLLTLEHSTDTGIQFFSATQTQLRFGDAASTAAGSIIYTHGDNILRFETSTAHRFTIGGSEAMRIDSSGNLLVNKTASGSLGTAGFEFASNNTLRATKGSSAPAEFNRLTNDGDIALFYKDTSPVGSIGVNSGDIYIASTGTYSAGLMFEGSSGAQDIRPCSKTGALLDGAVDLGDSSARFKDLYLSGGIQFDSRSNKLDDYEEGTWTPVLQNTGGTTATHTTQAGKYTKIGNTVHVHGTITCSSGANMTGTVIINGLPFTSNSTGGARNVGQLGALQGCGTEAEKVRLVCDPNQSYIFIIKQIGQAYTHNPSFNSAINMYGFSIVYSTA
jgi:hypothetical protein